MTETARTHVWPILTYRDAPAAIRFLVDAFGLEARAVYERDAQPGVVEHAELRWPAGGGIMLGTAGKDDSPFGRRPSGNDCVYVVCDEPDALFARATAAGAEVVLPLKDESYGSRGFTVRDPEGNLWSFGTYAGHEGGGMIDHVKLVVADLAASRAFYERALAPLGIAVLLEYPGAIGLGVDGKPFFWLAAGPASGPCHVAFASADHAGVDAFHREALAAGGTDHGAPGPRPQYHPGYYGAFVLDPDGNNVEAVCHRPA